MLTLFLMNNIITIVIIIGHITAKVKKILLPLNIRKPTIMKKTKILVPAEMIFVIILATRLMSLTKYAIISPFFIVFICSSLVFNNFINSLSINSLFIFNCNINSKFFQITLQPKITIDVPNIIITNLMISDLFESILYSKSTISPKSFDGKVTKYM
jgi:hypothetical protein